MANGNYYGQSTGFAVYLNSTNKGVYFNSSGDAIFNSTTNATDTSDGSFHFSGGGSVMLDMFIGGQLTVPIINISTALSVPSLILPQFLRVDGYTKLTGLEVIGSQGLPPSIIDTLHITGGNFGQTIGRIFIGDGNGKNIYFSARQFGTTADLIKFDDFGNITLVGRIENIGGGPQKGLLLNTNSKIYSQGVANSSTLELKAFSGKGITIQANGTTVIDLGAIIQQNLEVRGQSSFSNSITIVASTVGRVSNTRAQIYSYGNDSESTVEIEASSGQGLSIQPNGQVNFDQSIYTYENATVQKNFEVRGQSNFMQNVAFQQNLQVYGQSNLLGSMNIIGFAGLPDQTLSTLYIAGGQGSPTLGRIYVGDGTGWDFRMSKRILATTTDLFKFDDQGFLTVAGKIQTTGTGPQSGLVLNTNSQIYSTGTALTSTLELKSSSGKGLTIQANGGTNFDYDIYTFENAVIQKNLEVRGFVNIKNTVYISDNTLNLPQTADNKLIITGGSGQPTIGRIFIGDGGGRVFAFARRINGVNNDVFKFGDRGLFTVNGSIQLFGSDYTNQPSGITFGEESVRMTFNESNNFIIRSILGGGIEFTSTASVNLGDDIYVERDATIQRNLEVRGSSNYQGAVHIQGSAGLPNQTLGTLHIVGGQGSPTLGRIFIGDGTGWNLKMSKRLSSTTTDLFSFEDSGNLKLAGTLNHPSAALGGMSFRQDGYVQTIGPLIAAGAQTGTAAYTYYGTSTGTETQGRGFEQLGWSILTNFSIYAAEFDAFSDERIKQSIKTLPSQINKIMKLNPVEYGKKDIKHKNNKHNGLLAQEVKKIFPEMVKTSANFLPDIQTICRVEKNKIFVPLQNKTKKIKCYLRDDTVIELGVKDINQQYITVSEELNVEDIFVYGTEVEDFHTLDYIQLIPILLQMCQEQQLRIEALEKIIKK